MNPKLILLIAIILVSIYTLRRRRVKIHPVSIANGLTYQIPFEQAKHFRLHLNQTQYCLEDFLHNQVSHPNIESTEVLYDGDLQANSDIKYQAPPLGEWKPQEVVLHIHGDITPHQVKTYLYQIRH